MYIYNSPKYKRWRERVFLRDRFSCRLCNSKGSLNAHHIKRKVDYPKLVFHTDNGISLCVKCHNIVTGNECLFETLLSKIVNKTLSIEYIYSFFNDLSINHKPIVELLKLHDKWLKIPKALLTKPEYSNGTDSGTGSRTRKYRKKGKIRKTTRQSRAA